MAELSGEAWHREQRRKSQDLIRVKNPTDHDYTLLWDEGGASVKFVIPARDKDMGWGNGMRVMQRYLAQKYTKEMVDKLIFERGDDKLQEWKKKLNKQGATAVEFNANQQLMGTQFMRSDDPVTRQPFEDEIWMGIEEEFGMDQETVDTIPKTSYDTNPFERLKDKRYIPPEKQAVKPTIKHDLSEVAQ